MIPFDLEAFRAGAIAIDREGNEWAWVRKLRENGFEFVARRRKDDAKSVFTALGKYYTIAAEHPCDLIATKPDDTRMEIPDRGEDDDIFHDAVHNPPHYQLLPGIEVIDVREALLARIPAGIYTQAQIDCWSRGLEYAMRFMSKGGMEDIDKAINYLHRMRYGTWFKGSEKQGEEK